MTIMLSFSDGDAFPYESRFTTLDKAFGEVLSKRYIEYNGKVYVTVAIVSVSAV